MIDFEYSAPCSLEEALSLLKSGKAKVLAGGTDLIVQMTDGRASPTALVDVKKIPELNRLEISADGTLHVGAAVPLGEIVAFAPLMQSFGVLHQACSLIGSVQIRNRATMGGNVCNAAPSADSAPPLLCLGARAVVAHPAGTKTIPLESFFKGPGQTALADNELLVEIEVPPLPPSTAGYYLRHTPRKEMDIAVVGAAAMLARPERGGPCSDVRISLGAVAPTPVRVPDAEAFLKGKAPDDAAIEEAAEIAVGAVSPISDVRASAEYRRELVKVLVRRALGGALEALNNLN